MPLGNRRRAASPAFVLIAVAASFGVLTLALGPAASATATGPPNLVRGSAYLVSPANLIGGHYYESFPHVADFGLTMDGALALAATGDQDRALRKIVTFIETDSKDQSGKTVDDWTGIGRSYASGGAIGKEALLAEVVGDNPRSFGGHNLIAALDASVCVRASPRANTSCPAAGSYLNATSVFDQALGIIAQLRAGQAAKATPAISYLESLQNSDGSFDSLIPSGGGSDGGGPDVDSTAMAAMALALAPGKAAAADVSSGLTWIASQQDKNGGFPGVGGDSVNSAGLAIQALSVQRTHYSARIDAALAFLRREQNSDGGFNADATGQQGSNLRASTQAVGGAVGTSFGTLRRNLSGRVAGAGRASARGTARTDLVIGLAVASFAVVAAVAGLALLTRRRRAFGRPTGKHTAAPPRVRS